MHPKSKLIDILGSTTHLSESIAEMLVKDLTYSGNLYKTLLIVTEDNIATMWRHQTHYVINCISLYIVDEKPLSTQHFVL